MSTGGINKPTGKAAYEIEAEAKSRCALEKFLRMTEISMF